MRICDFLKKKARKKPDIKMTCAMHVNRDIPAYQSDYAKTIYLNWFATPKEKPKAWPQYFAYECGIKNCEQYFAQLCAEELVAKAPTSKQIKSLKMADLKNILSTVGLPTSGNKQQLIDRVLQNIADNDLQPFLGKSVYCLSLTGKLFVSQHEQYVILHKHRDWGITWQGFDQAHRQGVDIYDTIWGLLNKRVLDEARTNFGRNAYASMAECALERRKPEEALALYLQVLYIDLCFCPHLVGFAPGIVSQIQALGDYYSIDLLQYPFAMRIPGRTSTQKEFAQIVESIIAGTIDINETETALRKRGGQVHS